VPRDTVIQRAWRGFKTSRESRASSHLERGSPFALWRAAETFAVPTYGLWVPRMTAGIPDVPQAALDYVQVEGCVLWSLICNDKPMRAIMAGLLSSHP
jgi:hypothetical protein